MVRILNFPEMPPPPEEGDESQKKEEASSPEEDVTDINKFRDDARDTRPVDCKYLAEFAADFTQILSGVPREIEKLIYQLPAQRQQRLLAQNQEIVSHYDDEALLAWTKKDKAEWSARPVFFYAVFLEARKRNLT